MRIDLDPPPLALTMLAIVQMDQRRDIHQLVKLFFDLFDARIGAAGYDRHAGQGRIFGRRHYQRLDIVAARRKQPGHARKRTRFVFHQQRNNVPHYNSSARIISDKPLPPGTMGNTFSVGSVLKSRNTRSSLRAKASFNAVSTSAGFSMRIPTCPYASASLTKSGSAFK